MMIWSAVLGADIAGPVEQVILCHALEECVPHMRVLTPSWQQTELLPEGLCQNLA